MFSNALSNALIIELFYGLYQLHTLLIKALELLFVYMHTS